MVAARTSDAPRPDPEVKVLAVKIRLARAGAKKAPFYRVVAADSRAPRDGRFIEILGRYNPRTEPSFVELDIEKIDAWIAKGAQPTEAAGKLIAIAKGEKAAPEGRGQGLEEGRRQGRGRQEGQGGGGRQGRRRAEGRRRGACPPRPSRSRPRACRRGARSRQRPAEEPAAGRRRRARSREAAE